MKIGVDRWCSFKLISLLSFFAFAVQTGAQEESEYDAGVQREKIVGALAE